MGAYRSASSTAPASKATSVTPSDATVFEVCRALYVGTTGNIAVRMADGTSLTFTSVPVGILPIQVDMVKSTGTTASNIIALY